MEPTSPREGKALRDKFIALVRQGVDTNEAIEQTGGIVRYTDIPRGAHSKRIDVLWRDGEWSRLVDNECFECRSADELADLSGVDIHAALAK